jgi:uncharacterized delta-60 repeat protein
VQTKQALLHRGMNLRRGSGLLAAAIVLGLLSAGGAVAAAGPLDPSFGTGGVVFAPSFANVACAPGNSALLFDRVRLAPNGDVFAAGALGVSGYLPSGGVDRAFAGGLVPGTDSDVVVLPDGQVLVSGYRGGPPGTAAYHGSVSRLNSNGKLDSTFGAGGTAYPGAQSPRAASESMLQGPPWLGHLPGGDVLAASVDGNGQRLWGSTLAELEPNGQLDPRFGKSGLLTLKPVLAAPPVVTPSGQILLLVIKPAATIDGLSPYRTYVMRLLPSGQADSTFGTNGIAPTGTFGLGGWADSLAVDGRGQIVVAATNGIVERLTNAGKLDQSFGFAGQVQTAATYQCGTTPGILAPTPLTITKGGEIILVGQAIAEGLGPPPSLMSTSVVVVLGVNGRFVEALRGSFRSKQLTNSAATAVAVQADGKLVVGGTVYGTGTTGGMTAFVARYLAPPS